LKQSDPDLLFFDLGIDYPSVENAGQDTGKAFLYVMQFPESDIAIVKLASFELG
jgi:hypothetical protein